MYCIYIDEAGTSAKEPVTVVVGVIIHADNHWRLAADKLQSTLDSFVPLALRPGFMFHAKEIWSGYREPDNTWSRAERIALIEAVASLPRMLGMAVSIGRVRRDWQFPLNTKLMKLHDFHHVVAFSRCVARANKYIRDWAHPDEIATVVAEDVSDKRRFLKKSLKTGHVNLPMTVEFVIPTKAEINAGEITQTNAGPIDRAIDTAHFVEKSDAPLLQIADACAFSFRRYFANQDGGDVLVRAILGSDLVWSDWQRPMSESTFSFNPAHRY